jgi:hypothetical protein
MSGDTRFEQSIEKDKDLGKIKVHSFIPNREKPKKVSLMKKISTEMSKMFKSYRLMMKIDKQEKFEHLDL